MAPVASIQNVRGFASGGRTRSGRTRRASMRWSRLRFQPTALPTSSMSSGRRRRAGVDDGAGIERAQLRQLVRRIETVAAGHDEIGSEVDDLLMSIAEARDVGSAVTSGG